MTEHDEQVRLKHILGAAREAVDMVSGMERGDLDHDRPRQLALVHLLEVIGEAASRVPAEVRKQFPEVPWGPMIGMRNRVIHGYDTIDYDRVWETVKVDLPSLIALVDRALGRRMD